MKSSALPVPHLPQPQNAAANFGSPETASVGSPEGASFGSPEGASFGSPEGASFGSLGLDAAILRTVHEAGYVQPTPVQREAIPAALAGADILASSQTGSGKTAAFLLPALHRLASRKKAHPLERTTAPLVLVLTPTRELALQVQKQAFVFSRGVRGIRTAVVVGGAAYAQQLRALRDADVLVATPGRLMDHLQRGRLDLSRVEVLVLDEADRMLDMGFIDDIDTIVAKTPASRQTMLFSATLDGVVGKLAERLTRHPVRVQVEANVANTPDIDQIQLHVDGLAHKTRLLDVLLRDASMNQAIVFTSTKRNADELSSALAADGFPAAALHGDMAQYARNRTLQQLRDGRLRVLVATDVAARGIDVATISHVINFDLPRQAEDYVHRIGRTGRAGRAGSAISFVAPDEHRQMKSIERLTGQRVKVTTVPGLEPKVAPKRFESKSPNGARRPRGEGAGAGGRPGRFRDDGRSSRGRRP